MFSYGGQKGVIFNLKGRNDKMVYSHAITTQYSSLFLASLLKKGCCFPRAVTTSWRDGTMNALIFWKADTLKWYAVIESQQRQWYCISVIKSRGINFPTPCLDQEVIQEGIMFSLNVCKSCVL